MSAFCSGNPGVPKSGSADDVLLNSVLIGALLSKYGLGHLAAFVGYLGNVITLHLPDICALDPPADSGLSGADLLLLATLGPGPLTAGPVARFTQLIQQFAWYEYCTCTVVDTPAAPDPPTITGIPNINPNTFPLPLVPPCYSADFGTPDLGFADSFVDITYTTGVPTLIVAYVTTQCIGIGDCSDTWLTVQPSWTDANGDNSTTLPPSVVPTGGSDVFQYIPHPVPTETNFFLTTEEGLGDLNSVRVHIDVYCNGTQPGQTQVPCCPPDQTLTAKLDAMLSLVTLIQRQVAPFAYITGAVHSGLSGTGTIDVQGTLGVLCNVSVPDRAGRDDGTPVTVFDVGWINFATDDGYTERFFLSSDSQLILPRVPGIYTHIGYTVAPDATVTITELLRES